LAIAVLHICFYVGQNSFARSVASPGRRDPCPLHSRSGGREGGITAALGQRRRRV